MIGGAKGIGLGIDLGLVNQYNRTGSQSYIEPEVLDSLVGVWSAYGMTNDSPNRSTIKNKLSNKGGDFVISNAAYDKMSSYGGYEFAKFDNTLDWYNTEGNDSVVVVSRNGHSITLKRLTGPNFWYFQNSTFRGLISNVIPFKVNSNKNISVIWDVHGLSISEGKDKSVRVQELVLNPNEDNYTNLKTLNEEELAQIDISTNSLYYLLWFDLSTLAVDEEVTIEMLPLFEGAFVTDGIDDLITSTKTVQEMLGGSNEITVVSMIHQVKDSSNNVSFTNYIRGSANGYFRNIVNNYDKTGIYGYTSSDLMGLSVVNNILGDKNDYTSNGDNRDSIINGNFSVQGYSYNDGNNTGDFSSVAWYWTVIANKVLTTDQINQVIAYFNLDRTLKPDILCDVKKQGITNDNHAEFGDKLIDFSGNGRDIQLNNIAWKGDSGIGKYETELSNTSIWTKSKETTSSPFSSSYNGLSGWTLFANTSLTNSADMPSFKIQVKGLLEGQELIYRYYDSNGQSNVYSITKDGDYTLPSDFRTAKPQISNTSGFQVVKNEANIITITQIPSHAGALLLDGVDDFGKVTGMPIYKDYTFIIDYERISYTSEGWGGAIVSKSLKANNGAFIFMMANSAGLNKQLFSFGGVTTFIKDDLSRILFWQTKYKSKNTELTVGEEVDGDTLCLGTLRDNDSRFFNGAIYSLMSFPYSMSEFLIERQLKKHKLGTLYPDMVEFRPVINSNIDIKKINYWDKDWNILHVGDYVSIGNDIKTNITVPNGYKVSKATSNAFDNITIEKSSTEFIYDVKFYGINKSPQNINLTIEQDGNYVLFNPTINSNAIFEVGNEETMPELFTQLNNGEIDGIILYMQGDKAVLPNNWIDKNTKVRAIIYCLDTVSEEDIHFTVDGKTKYCYSAIEDGLAAFGIMDEDSQEEQYMTNVLTANTIDIQLDQYIRYEDIVQPYPVLLRFNDENGNEVSWGGKFRVGSTITRIGSFYENNLIDGLYIVRNPKLNGNNLITPTHVVEKSMVFTCDTEYLLDNNEPKCILSPSRLRMPNSSYKILGYIPDISGHGNHGVIHNSAYAGMSGANGYLQNFSGWTKASGVSSTDSVISSSNNLVAANGWIAYVTSGNVIPTFKVEISGIPVNGNLRFEGSDQVLVNGVNTIQGLTTTKVSGFYISSGYDNDWSNLKIEQIGKYEGAYCFDGVDDFVTIPTVTGGKQVLMKVNWDSSNSALLYDQRGYNNEFAIYNGSADSDGNPIPAYSGRNNGQTYIDGILNSNIKASELRAITHNITITNELSAGVNKFSPVIGSNRVHNAYFTNMALYDFMLFDEISTDDKIKELNKYVGIEGNVWGILTKLSNSTLISNETLIKNE